MRVRLDTPAGFSFRRTVLSHGWWNLAPFRYDDRAGSLGLNVALPDGGATSIELRPAGSDVLLLAAGRPPAALRRRLVRAARRVLNLDLDLEPFYALLRDDGDLRWIAEAGAGRLLRGPTLFEDLVKLVLTTNCSWALTRRMVERLIAEAGSIADDGSRAFPTPAALARLGARRLRQRVRAGYRAPLLAELARRVARGRVDPERWEDDPRDVAALKREMLELPGVGPYVAENLLKLVGRPAGLALDSWLRAKYARLYHGGRRVADRTIARRYAQLGEWAGIAIWCEMTRDWFEGDEAGAARAALE